MAGIATAARTAPDSPAVVDGARVVTFAELDDRQRAVAGFLHDAGVAAADRVAVVSVNRVELLEVVVGALRAAIVPVPVHPALSAREAAYLIDDARARVVFADRPVEPRPGVERVVVFGDAYERCLHDAPRAELADVTLGRPLHYTSGTTGRPKGVWVPPDAAERAAEVSEDFRRTWSLASDDRHLVCSPLTHSAPHRFALRTLEAGGAVVLRPRFDAADALAAIDLFGVTTTFMVPTHLERIRALHERGPARHDLTSLRLVVHAGAPIRPETKRAILELFPAGSVWEFYGSTEGQATRISAAEWLRKPGSVGRPRAGASIRIADTSGAPLAPGEVGIVWIHDPAADRFEYWGDPEGTAAAWRDGAFTAGDLGYLDDDGYLYLTGRRDDAIVTGGVNVQPAEVEDVLASHPAVAEVLVYGAAHEDRGQEVRALVVPAHGRPLDPDRLHAWARERLAGYKCPRAIEIVDELPRTPTGKPRRPG